MTKQFFCIIFFLLLSCNSKGENNNENQENIMHENQIDHYSAVEEEYIDKSIEVLEATGETIERNELQPDLSLSVSNNYNNGNGTIIEINSDGDTQWVYRRHIQSVKIGDMSRDQNLIIYDRPLLENGTIIGTLELDETVNILQIAEAIVSKEYVYWWLNIISEKNINGWIFGGKHEYRLAQSRSPYFNNNWEILETINIREKSWTVRKIFNHGVSVWYVLDIHNRPGLVDTNVISKITEIPPVHPQLNLRVTEVTEEMETIDGMTDRWIKINYNGTEGWIFGGYASVDRGGPQYRTPENIISFGIGWY